MGIQVSREDAVIMFMAKVRNVVYYYKRDQRPYKQYLHILRDIGKYAKTMYSDILVRQGNDDKLEDFFKSVVSLVSPKIKPAEIPDCIDNLERLLEKYYE